MKNNRRKAVLLMAGKSERFSKTGVKKQFALLLNKESFLYPLESFISSQLFEEIILVIEEEDRNHIEKILARENLVFPHRFVIGGENRNASVNNALIALKEEGDFKIFIHDAARVILPLDILLSLNKEIETVDACVPYLPIADSIYQPLLNRYVNRDDFVRIQTPQVFDYQKLFSLFQKGFFIEDTDDFSKAIRAGFSYKLVLGSPYLYKLTYPEDQKIIETALLGGVN